jgi:hypothetical protein
VPITAFSKANVSLPSSGHAHQAMRRVLEAAISQRKYTLPDPDFYRRGDIGQTHGRDRDASVIGGDRVGERPQPSDNYTSPKIARGRYLSILA